MAFDNANFHRVGSQNSNGPTLWVYSNTSDALTTMDGAGYFGNNTKSTIRAADRLQVGDIILAVGASNTYGIFVVNANSRDLTTSPPTIGTVDVTNATSIGTIDSD